MRISKDVLGFCIIFVIFQNCFGCSFDAPDERAHCPSFAALKQAGDHPEWKRLNVNNPGSEQFGPIKEGLFEFCKNVKDLQVKGLADDIHPGAWKGLENLYELHLDDNKLNVIPSNAFANLPIEVIYLYSCNIKELLPKSFDNLPKLRWVLIHNNNISRIEEGVFTGTDISHLILRKNRIRTVDSNSFGNMDNLQHLSLEENELSSFAPQQAIGYAPKLTHLYINRNKIRRATQDMFTGMPNLLILLLNINQIERFGNHAFKDLKKLQLLDISNNKLEELQTNIFNSKGMPNLRLLFLHDNNLSFLSTGFLSRMPNLMRITVVGNPWQCPCWWSLSSFLDNHNVTQLCDDIYKDGKRPSCVFMEKQSKDCIYDVENARDIPRLYQELLKDYPKLPPVCNVDGTDKPYLAD